MIEICTTSSSIISRVLQGQLVSLKLEKIFLTLLKILPCYEDFLVTYFLPLLLECCAEIILISFELLNTSELKFSMSCQTFISSPFSHTLTVIFAMFTPPSKMTWKCKKLYYGLRLIFLSASVSCHHKIECLITRYSFSCFMQHLQTFT